MGLKGLHFWKRAKKALRNPARRHSKALKMETNGPRDLKSGLKYSLEYPLCDQRCSQKLFFQNWGQKGLFFDKGSNKALRNPVRRHSKALKMETNGPRDLKLGLKHSLDYPICCLLYTSPSPRD